MATKKSAEPIIDLTPVTPEPVAPEAAPVGINERLIEMFERQTSVQERLEANQPRKRVTQADIIKREQAGRWNKGEFKYPVYQNGLQADSSGCSNDTLQKAATVASGRYINDVVEVIRTGKHENTRIFLFYDITTIDKRMALKSHFTSFSDLFVKIHTEMAARGIKPVE